ncbi:298_t:CDS:2 [Ambispora gerdemannii]|uniref:298_t:CDS:1 n=1 Tax=Ambispora gerdemannii TaxID=144530 RepID=A0A9N8ZJT0_9GLOM|nr:298_t:CDS:2 [Ambispora gerdemannii]
MNGQDMPMDAASFLPLVLQAQDLVCKLESRVVELENDLETINEAHEQEREQLLQEIGEKDEYIHNLKTKVSRLEFGAREAIVVLARTNNVKVPRNNAGRRNHRNYETPKRRQSQLSDFDTTKNNNSSKQLPPHPIVPVRRDSKLQPSSEEITPVDEEIKNTVAVDELDRLEDLDGSEDITAFDLLTDDEDTNNFASQYQKRETVEETSESNLVNLHEEPQEYINNIKPDEDEHRPIENVSHHTQSICPNCESLLAQADQHIEERAYIKRDLSALAISLSEEQTLRMQIQSAKEDLESEIDDWVNAMFEKVNQMVFDEANAREDLEILNRETKGKLSEALKASASREDRLREMKLLLVHLDSTKQRQAIQTSTPAPGVLSRASSIRRSIMSNSPISSPRASRNFGHMSPSLFSMDDFMFAKGKKIYLDGIVYEEFQEYVKAFTTSPAPNNLNLNAPFMKRCMAEDIQPCLFEGKSGWKSPFYKRRLLEAIMKSQCEIQTIYFNSSMPGTPTTSQISISSRSSYQEPPPPPKVKCGLCGCSRSCEYRMRISGPDAAVPPTATTLNSSARLSVTEKPGWIPLDRFCRDRVVAVCDFYAYLSHLRQGLLANSPVWGMYKQCLKHRRKMGMARVGSISMFEQDDNTDFENADMEGMVTDNRRMMPKKLKISDSAPQLMGPRINTLWPSISFLSIAGALARSSDSHD